VGVVILDEFHYMNDVSRGTVWEECCILSPPSAQLVALSATMANAHRITSWLEAIHGPTTLVETSFRPVPLRYWYADDLGLESLFSEAGAGPGAGGKHGPKGWRMNAVLAPERRAAERERMYGIPPGGTGGREGGRGDGGAREAGRRGSQKWSRRGDSGGGRPDRSRSGEGGEGAGGRGGGDRQSRYSLRQRAQSEIAPMPTLLRELSRRSLLPAIAFIFSRVGCDAAAEAAARLRTPLVSRSEQREIEALLRAFEAKNGALIDSLVPRRWEWGEGG
jgi:superfamily II RNA helicase